MDNYVGSFLYHLVQTDLGKDLADSVDNSDILDVSSDEISTICDPLVRDYPESKITEGNYPAEAVMKRTGKRFASPILNSCAWIRSIG